MTMPPLVADWTIEMLDALPDDGKVMISPSDVWCGERSRNRVQPDVYVVKRVNGRRAPYPREGVAEYWVVHP